MTLRRHAQDSIAAIEDPAVIVAIPELTGARLATSARAGFAVVPAGLVGQFRRFATSQIACEDCAGIALGPNTPRHENMTPEIVPGCTYRRAGAKRGFDFPFLDFDLAALLPELLAAPDWAQRW